MAINIKNANRKNVQGVVLEENMYVAGK